MNRIIASLTLLAAAWATMAAQSPTREVPENSSEQQLVIVEAVEVVENTPDNAQPVIPAAVPFGSDDKLHFAWGASAGGGIDLTGSEMSCVELALSVGMRWQTVKFLGLGVQADLMVSNSCRSYPIYAHLCTNFRPGPSLLFWDLRGGVSINYLEDNLKQSGAYVSTGLGVVLASGTRYSSHLIFGYEFRSRKPIETETAIYNLKDLHGITARIGITF